MIWLAAAAAIAASPPATNMPRAVVAQAHATVRIISGVRLKLDSTNNADAPAAHNGRVTTNGAQQPARLIEFE